MSWNRGKQDIREINRGLAKVRLWRRRVLEKKGTRMHRTMLERGDDCSLAILDSQGMVVCWFGSPDGADLARDRVLDRHVSQFYIAEDIALCLPYRHLRSAFAQSSNSEEGWRRRAVGIFWATTVTESLLLPDGRLQGYSRVTRASKRSQEDLQALTRERTLPARIATMSFGPYGGFQIA